MLSDETSRQPLAPRRWFDGIAAGAGLLAAFASVMPLRQHSLPNFLFFWGPQAALLGGARLTRTRPGVVGGAALVLAVYLVGFHGWMGSRPAGDALAWLYYLFSFPGAVVGVFVAALASRRRGSSTPRNALLSAALTSTGLAVALGLLLVW